MQFSVLSKGFVKHKQVKISDGKEQRFGDIVTPFLSSNATRRSFRSYNRAFKLALQSHRSADYKAVLDDSSITVDKTSLDQHKLFLLVIFVP